MRLDKLRAVLFDFDGTLADTAPDLAAAANAMRAARGLAPLPLETFRPVASQGARGLLRVSLGKTPDDADYEELRGDFLLRYGQALHVHTRLFDGIAELLAAIEACELAWGIVTNKAARFTDPLVELLGLAGRAAVVVSGDTTAHIKPHPASLLHAAQALKLAAEACLYVGDDLRDVQAARAASMPIVAAAYGYCVPSEVASWKADAVVYSPDELIELLGLDRATVGRKFAHAV